MNAADFAPLNVVSGTSLGPHISEAYEIQDSLMIHEWQMVFDMLSPLKNQAVLGGWWQKSPQIGRTGLYQARIYPQVLSHLQREFTPSSYLLPENSPNVN